MDKEVWKHLLFICLMALLVTDIQGASPWSNVVALGAFIVWRYNSPKEYDR